jgi:hypothetical protein
MIERFLFIGGPVDGERLGLLQIKGQGPPLHVDFPGEHRPGYSPRQGAAPFTVHSYMRQAIIRIGGRSSSYVYVSREMDEDALVARLLERYPRAFE